jgi:hypothetical protein
LYELDSQDADSCMEHLPVGREARTFAGWKGMDTHRKVQGIVAVSAIMPGLCGPGDPAVATPICLYLRPVGAPSAANKPKPPGIEVSQHLYEVAGRHLGRRVQNLTMQ